MSSRGIIMDAYHDAISAEVAYLDSGTPELVQGYSLPYLGSVVASGATLIRNLDNTKPLPSHRLAIAAFSAVSNPLEGMTPNDTDAIAAFHNDVILSLAGVSVDAVPTHSVRSSVLGGETCPLTETTFVDAIRQVDYVAREERAPRWVGPNHVAHRTLSVYAGEDGEPLILRKRRDITLGLALKHLLLNDSMIIPAGTFVSVGGRSAQVAAELSGTHVYQAPTKANPEGWSFRSYTVSDRFAVRPLRIGPWAYDDATRRGFFGIDRTATERPHYQRGRSRQITNHTLDDFRATANQIMEMCS